MRHYITLFDKNYIHHGVALYKSLKIQSSEAFHLWVVALDKETVEFLNHMNFPSITVILYSDLGGDVRQRAATMEWKYFCWMMASEATRLLQDMVQTDVTYLDSDVFFFNDPYKMFLNLGKKEVGIVSHNFPAHDYARLAPNGLYNVSIVHFANTPTGKETLAWWNDKCREKCDASTCGDQKYLDWFPQIVGDKLHIFDGKRIGAGPWNAYTYQVYPGPCIDDYPLIAYHFHETRRIKDYEYRLTGYPVPENNKEYIYNPYVSLLNVITDQVDGFFK